MHITPLSSNNIPAAASLALALWPDANYDELVTEFTTLLTTDNNMVSLAYKGEEAIAFVHVSLRSEYVEGTSTSPVGYVEGIYVKPDFRHQQIGKALIQAGEEWALSKGCTEFASDVELHNEASIHFHESMGFTEVNRVVLFAKRL